MCHWGRASFFSRRSPCVCARVCVSPSADWQLGLGVCVGGDRMHLLSAWLYMVGFVFATPGQHWHIEVFISRKQVAEERDERAHTSPPPCLSLCSGICTAPSCAGYAYRGGRTCVCPRVCERSLLYFGACDIWRFAPKANKSVMPGIRPWPLLKLHRQAERLINQTASHRCDGFHTNRQQTVKVTSNRVNCQPGRQAGRTFALHPPLFLIPHCCVYLSLCFCFISPPAWYPGATHAEYLSCPSKNDLEGQGKSIFSDSGHGLTILGTQGVSHYCAPLWCVVTAVLLSKCLFLQHWLHGRFCR